MRLQCGCVWLGVRCPNEATAEDGLCDWCSAGNARTEEHLRKNPAAIIAPDGTFSGLGGAGQVHDAPLADSMNASPSACWYPDSGRTVAPPVVDLMEALQNSIDKAKDDRKRRAAAYRKPKP